MIGSLALLIIVWAVLVRRPDGASLGIGIASSAFALLMGGILFPHRRRFLPAPVRRPLSFLRLLLSLAVRVTVSTVRTSCLIIFGGEEGRIIALPTRIAAPFGRLLLLNAITLTPSTISRLIDRDLLYIHWLGSREGKAVPSRIKEGIEAEIAALFGEKGVRRDRSG